MEPLSNVECEANSALAPATFSIAQHFAVACNASRAALIKAGSLASPRIRAEECCLHGGDANVTIARVAFCKPRNSVGLQESPQLKVSSP
jgi:hypothetical protein